MSVFSRRGVLGMATGGTLAGLSAAFLGRNGSRAWAAQASRTRFRAVVIGSGFGGAVAALRLGEAGVDTVVLERGREWPTAPDRAVFGSANGITDTMFWFRDTARWPAMPPVPVPRTPGVMEVSQEHHLDIACGAAVGGGSVVYTGVTLAPPRRYFEALYPAGLEYGEFERTWFPRVRAMLGARRMPREVYSSAPFTHSRLWDRQMARARMPAFPLDSTFDWDVIRGELSGRKAMSATVGDSDFGCGNGAKRSLTRNYLPAALATGSVQLRPLHEVRSIGRGADGRYRVVVRRLGPDGSTLDTTAFTCDLLFVAAGTLNTNRLLVAARERGELPDLPDSVGSGFGDNGDQINLRSQPLEFIGPSQASPSASGAFAHHGFELPLLTESWVLPGYSALPATVTFSMTVDTEHRGTFRLDPGSGKVFLSDWSREKSAASARAALAHGSRVVEACPGTLPLTLNHPRTLTAHPLGGCVIGRATDLEGRVRGNPGLYVVDGSLVPGNAGGANPSLTIAALAERAMSGIIAAGG